MVSRKVSTEIAPAATQRQSVTAALRQNTGTGDFAADLEYLRALQETLEQGHEQS